jgi:hypothetical protein
MRIKQAALAALVGLLCMAEIMATQGTSWMTLAVVKAYGLTYGPRLTEVAGWTLSGALVVVTLTSGRLLQPRYTAAFFMISALAFAILGVGRQSPWLALSLLGLVGALGIQRPLFRAVTPGITELPGGTVNTIISGVFVLLTPISFFALATLGNMYGAAAAYRVMAVTMAGAFTLAVAVFWRSRHPTAGTGAARGWTRRSMIGAILNGLNVAAFGPQIYPLGAILLKHGFRSGLWILVVNAAAIPGAIVLLGYWARRADRLPRYGVLRAQSLTLLGSVVLFLGERVGNGQWMAVELAGMGLLAFAINAFEASLNALVAGGSRQRALVLVVGRTLLFTASGLLGNVAVYAGLQVMGLRLSASELSLGFGMLGLIGTLALMSPVEERGQEAPAGADHLP